MSVQEVVRIDACIDDLDVEGAGATLDDALAAIASNCDASAARFERSAAALRAAATNYRDRIMSTREPPPEPPPATERLASTADRDWMDVHDGGPHA